MSLAHSVHEIKLSFGKGKRVTRRVEIKINSANSGTRIIHENGKLVEKANMNAEEISAFMHHDTLHGHGFRGKTLVPAEETMHKAVIHGSSESNIQTEKELKQAIQHHDKLIVLFHHPTCPHCVAFVPIFDQVAARFKGDEKIGFAKVNVGVSWDNTVGLKYKANEGVPLVLVFSKNGRYESIPPSDSVESFLKTVARFLARSFFRMVPKMIEIDF